jgi:ribonuclease P protein component
MRVTTQCFLLLVSGTHPPGSTGPTRLGTTVSRKVGIAVKRNVVKRRIREWFRRNRESFPPQRDVVVIARPGAAALPARQLDEQLDDAARRIGARIVAQQVR